MTKKPNTQSVECSVDASQMNLPGVPTIPETLATSPAPTPGQEGLRPGGDGLRRSRHRTRRHRDRRFEGQAARRRERVAKPAHGHQQHHEERDARSVDQAREDVADR